MGQRYQSLHVHSHASCFHGEFYKLIILIENEKHIDFSTTLWYWIDIYFFSCPYSYAWSLCSTYPPHKQEKSELWINLKLKVKAWRFWSFCPVLIGLLPTMLTCDIQMWKKLTFIQFSKSLTLGLDSSFLHSWDYFPPIIEKKFLKAQSM